VSTTQSAMDDDDDEEGEIAMEEVETTSYSNLVKARIVFKKSRSTFGSFDKSTATSQVVIWCSVCGVCWMRSPLPFPYASLQTQSVVITLLV
jgi:hypothetical protein